MSGFTFTGVTPYLYYADAAAALDWLERAFGFGPQSSSGSGGRVEEAEIGVGPVTIDLCGRTPGPNEGGGALLIVHVDDVDALHAHVSAAVGDEVEVAAVRDEPYGPRVFNVTDPWGYRWYFWQGTAVFD